MNAFGKKKNARTLIRTVNQLHLIIETVDRGSKWFYDKNDVQHTFGLLRSITRSGLTSNPPQTNDLSFSLIPPIAIGIIRIPIRLSVCVLSSIVRIFFMNSFLLAMPRFSLCLVFRGTACMRKRRTGFL